MRLAYVLVVASLCLACGVTSASGRTPQQQLVPGSVDANAAPAAAQATPALLRSLARLFVHWKEQHGEVATEVGTELLKEYLRGEKCSNLLPAPFFCPAPNPVTPRISPWGVGYALTWHGGREFVWDSPSSPRSVIRFSNGSTYTLTPGKLYWLTCYAYGDTATDGGISTNLWYRMPSGGWVNDGWVETATNNPIPGVRHC